MSALVSSRIGAYRAQVREPLALTLHHLPLTLEFALFDRRAGAPGGEGGAEVERVALDPTLQEEAAAGGSNFLVTVNQHGELCALHKAGGAAVPSAALSVAPPASLLEVIKDPTGLFYFCEFMERHRATNLINFWVTVEGYSAAASSAGSSSSSSSSSGSNGVAGGKARTVGSTGTSRSLLPLPTARTKPTS